MTLSEPAKSHKVLVVEDEGLIAADIASRLEALGHQPVGPASTAEEAVDLASGAEIVLMDIRIDGSRDGIDAAVEIRSRYPIPIVFLTAHADRSTLERAKKAGPFGYIVKPLGPASLQAGIETAIAKHRTERLLEEREAWLRASIGCAADAIAVCSPDGSVRLLNGAAQRLTGWTQVDAEGKPVQKVVRLIAADSGQGEGEWAAECDALPLALLRDAPVEFERRCRLLARDGRELEVDGSVAPVYNSKDLLGAVMTFRDASARHWEEKQLRQTQKLEAAARLAAGAANEYTSLVAGIRSQAERLLRQFAESSAPRAALEEIQTAAAAAESVTRRLAVFGSRQEVQPEAFSLNGVLRRMARLIESAAGSRIQVAMLPTPGSGQVLADAAQIESAILSLVHHACAAMPEGGQLLVETNRVELPRAGRAMEYVLLAIGYSTADPEIDRLFEAESVLDSGAGLALAAVHSAVVEAGGHISARLDGNGGSRIEMLLPRWSEEELLPRAGADSTEPSAVLLVDEREHVRADLHNFFEASGYNLLEASDAAEAIALGELHEGRLDLVVANLGDAQAIGRALSGSRPSLQVLSVVDRQESGAGEIQRPFTRQALLEKAAGLMGAPV